MGFAWRIFTKCGQKGELLMSGLFFLGFDVGELLQRSRRPFLWEAHLCSPLTPIKCTFLSKMANLTKSCTRVGTRPDPNWVIPNPEQNFFQNHWKFLGILKTVSLVYFNVTVINIVQCLPYIWRMRTDYLGQSILKALQNRRAKDPQIIFTFTKQTLTMIPGTVLHGLWNLKWLSRPVVDHYEVKNSDLLELIFIWICPLKTSLINYNNQRCYIT